MGRILDYRRITEKRWYLPILLLMPALMVVENGVMTAGGVSLAGPQTPLWLVLPFFLVFFITAIGEELGWSGYATDPLRQRYDALPAGVILGSIWAIWHLVPFVQTHHAPAWVAWQCASIVGVRVLIVWILSNTGGGVFAAILFHGMVNVSEFLFPTYGSHYDPFTTTVILAIIIVVVVALWGATTLAQFRFA